MKVLLRNCVQLLLILNVSQVVTGEPLPEPPPGMLQFEEDWGTGKIDPVKWYVLRKHWGNGNNGVVPENVWIERDQVFGKNQNVLVCEAHGDQYAGDIVGWEGRKQRVGGVIVTKQFFCSGRFEVVMKIGSVQSDAGGPVDSRRPCGSVPAIWTYGYRGIEVKKEEMGDFVVGEPLYNPHMPQYGVGMNEYWSEIDFPEFGKGGLLERLMYNTFCQNRHHSLELDVPSPIDAQYHTLLTEWRTNLQPLEDVRETQLVEHAGYWWVKDKSIPFENYLGNPLKKLGENRFAVYSGLEATHWIDGRKVAQNRQFVPAMEGQLNLGVWLPEWGGPAPWEKSSVRFASIKVWQYNDPGDVRGILYQDLLDNFDSQGSPIDLRGKVREE